MTEKHTPGPWEGQAERSGPNSWNEGVFARIEGRGKLIARFDASYEEYPEKLEEVQANVRLMAAAPDLLHALREVIAGVRDIRGIDVEGYRPVEFAIARAAILKATGEQS